MVDRIFINNIPFNAKKEQVEAIFADSAGFKSIDIPISDSGKLRGIGFVQFDSPQSAKQAVAKHHGTQLLKRSLVVKLDEKAPPSPSRPPASPQSATKPQNLDVVRKSASLLITGIPDTTPISDLLALGEKFGDVKELVFPSDTTGPRTSAFVTFEDSAKAVAFFTAGPHSLGSHQLKLTPRAARTPAPSTPVNKSPAKPATPAQTKPPESPAPNGTAHTPSKQSSGALTKQEIAVLRVFEILSKDTGGDKSDEGWVQYTGKKGSIQRELQMQGESRSVSYTSLVHNLELGAVGYGSFRAQLLKLWLDLLSRKKQASRFKDPSGAFVPFNKVFVNTRTLENVIVTIFTHPLDEPIAEDILPEGETVESVLLTIMGKTLIGSHSLHVDLISSVKSIAGLGQALIPMQLRQNIGDMFTCFKVDFTDKSMYQAQLASVEEEIIKLESAGGSVSSAELLRLLEQKWGIVLKMAGVGGGADVGQVFRRLSAEMGAVTAATATEMHKQRDDLARLDAEIVKLNAIAEKELDRKSEEYHKVESRVSTLQSRRDELAGRRAALVQRMETIKSEKDHLQQSTSVARQQHIPRIKELQSKRSTAAEALASEEAMLVSVEQVTASLRHAHSFLKAETQKKTDTRAPDHKDMPALVQNSLDLATQCIKSIVEDAKKNKKRADFCHTKLASMRLEQQELKEVGYEEIAGDLDSGLKRLTNDLSGLNHSIEAAVREGQQIVGWLDTLRGTGRLNAKETKTIDKLVETVDALRV